MSEDEIELPRAPVIHRKIGREQWLAGYAAAREDAAAKLNWMAENYRLAGRPAIAPVLDDAAIIIRAMQPKEAAIPSPMENEDE